MRRRRGRLSASVATSSTQSKLPSFVAAAKQKRRREFVSFAIKSLDDAYAIQHCFVEQQLNRGEELCGFKVGCTSEAIYKQLGLTGPVFGCLFASEQLQSGAEVALSDYDRLGIEGELAVSLSVDPRSLPDSPATLRDAIQAVFPVIELHALPNDIEHLTLPNVVANNALSAGFVHPQTHTQGVGIESAELTIRMNGQPVARSTNQELQATIYASLAWLATELTSLNIGYDVPVCPTILCGSSAPLFPIDKPVHIEANAGKLGVTTCTVV